MSESRRRKRIDDEAEDDAGADEAQHSGQEDEEEGSSKRKRRKSAVGSDEEMEASEGEGSDAAGSGSGSSSGSEDEADDAMQFDEDGYGDAADRAKLDAMPQVEREQLLFSRQEKREEAIARREAKRAERERKREKKKDKSSSSKDKKKAAKKAAKKAEKKAAKKAEREAKEAAKPRSRAAKRDADAKRSVSDALADLVSRKTQQVTSKASSSKRATREGDEDEEEEAGEEEDEENEDEEAEEEDEDEDSAAARRRRARRKKSHAYDSEDEQLQDVADAGGDDADAGEEDDGMPRTRTEVTWAQLKSIQLRRTALEKIIDEPYFAELVTNMFVRLSVGTRLDGTPAYRLCQIGGVQEWKGKYKFGTPAKDTRLALLLRFGRSERLWQCSSISNQSIDESEFKKWAEQMKLDGLTPISAEECARLRKKALTLRQSYEYSPDVIAKLIAEKRAQGKGLKAANLTTERERLRFELNQARDQHNVEAEQKALKQLEELDEIASAQQSKLAGDSKAAQSVTGILEINKRNVQQNTERLEAMLRVQREEKKRQDEEAARRRAAGEAPAPVERDAFKRKETRPTMDFILNAEQVAEEAKQQQAAEKAKKEAEKKAKEEQARLAKQHAARNKLEHFDELESAGVQSLPTPTAAASAATSFLAGMPAVASSSGASRPSPFLHLPSLPSLADKLVTALHEAHRNAANSSSSSAMQIDFDAKEPSSTLASVLGRFVSPSGGCGAAAAMADNRFAQPQPGAHVLSLDEYMQQRM